ncbi:MAG: hypothetical protein LCH53_06680 [Bacteroidetes bacterium]|nr:hypothetical protein [Bacteroidota bacterium]
MRTALAALLIALVLPLAACDSGNDALPTDTPSRIEATGAQTVEVFARGDTAVVDVTTLFQAFDPAKVSLALSADTAAHATLSGTTLSVAPINEGTYTVNVIARPHGGEKSSAQVTVQARADWCPVPPSGMFDPFPYKVGDRVSFTWNYTKTYWNYNRSIPDYEIMEQINRRGDVEWQFTHKEYIYGNVKFIFTESYI